METWHVYGCGTRFDLAVKMHKNIGWVYNVKCMYIESEYMSTLVCNVYVGWLRPVPGVIWMTCLIHVYCM